MVQYYRTPRSGDPSPVHQHFPAIDITPLCCHFWWLKDWHHTSLSFPYWRLYWNANPGAYVTLQDAVYRLDPTHVLLVPPNTPFSTDLEEPAAPSEYHSDHLLGGPAAGIQEVECNPRAGAVYHFFAHFSAGLPYDDMRPRIFRFPVDEPVRNTLRVLLFARDDEAENISHREGFLLKGLIANLMSRVPDDAWPSIPQDRRIREVVRIINGSIQRSHPNQQLAAAAGMSTNAFARLFKEQTGRSPQLYLCARRIRKACVLLHHTDKTIDVIAEECGFCNRHYFTRVFTGRTKTSPAAYRRQRHPVPPQP